ncbi:MAG TPA: hypothetical protein EYP30_07785 [Archaeoglobaceae archaeon]|nr:hypothetical protein [Archaeoglobaceae archaeon]
MNTGKLGIDMIAGLTIFMLSFIFIAQYIPSIFAVEGMTSLQPVAYRTAAILIKDTGYWTNGSANGTDWWNHTGSIRIGLAKHPRSEINKSKYNILSTFRIQKLAEFYKNSGYYEVQKALGLYSPQRSYEYNISIRQLSSSYATYNEQPVLLIGKPVPASNVAKFERYIVYDNLTSFSISGRIGPETNVTDFNINPPVGAFVIIVDGIDNLTNPNFWLKVWLNGNKVIDVSGNDTLSVFDLTDEVNSYSSVNVKVDAHNIRGIIISTNAGSFVGGRIVARLVVTVW